MFQTSQCTWSSVVRLRATSGSCMCSTKLAVFGGALVQVSAGETCSPACVYLAGIGAPSANAVVFKVIAGPAGAPPARWPPWPPAGGVCAASAPMTTAATNIADAIDRVHRIRCVLPLQADCRISDFRFQTSDFFRFIADLKVPPVWIGHLKAL